MSTGPQNYVLAEQDLDAARRSDRGSDWERFYLAAAQVHATLALAAATAMGAMLPEEDSEAWDAVAGVQEDDDDPYAGMTNADVMSGEEMAEYDRDAEADLAADEARNAAEAPEYDDAGADDDLDPRCGLDDEDGAE